MKNTGSNEAQPLTKDCGHQKVQMDTIAKKASENLEMRGCDGRLVKEHRKIFDEMYLKQVSAGASDQKAFDYAIAAASIEAAKE